MKDDFPKSMAYYCPACKTRIWRVIDWPPVPRFKRSICGKTGKRVTMRLSRNQKP